MLGTALQACYEDTSYIHLIAEVSENLKVADGARERNIAIKNNLDQMVQVLTHSL